MTDRGSVFIEALVASAIIALAVLAMLQSMVQTARRDKAMDDRRMALLVAQSELAAVGSAIPLEAQFTSGNDGPYAWTVSVRPLSRSGALVTFDVSVAVRRPPLGNALVTLHSMRAAAP